MSARVSLTPSSAGRLLAVVTLISVMTSFAAADVVHLTNGKTLTGKVTHEDGKIVVTTGSGTVVRLEKADVSSVSAAPTPEELLARKEQALPVGDADAVYLLSKWCKKQQLNKDAGRLIWRTIEIDPNHRDARRDLDFHKVGAVWLTNPDYQRSQGKLFFDGSWLGANEHAVAVRKARTERRVAEARSLFHTAAGTGKDAHRQSALTEFRQLPKSLQAWTLLKSAESLKARDRQFAVRELGSLGDRRYSRHLAHMAVTDTKRSVRDESIRVLKTMQDEDTVLSLLPYLSSDNERFRINAARAVNHFPDRRAAGALIRTAHFVWGGFGRSHIQVITQRSYVSDYELVSGGTGLVVQEVADPVVDTFQEGVILDIDIRRAEAFARAASLQSITGQKFGTNFAKWSQWWKEETGRLAISEKNNAAGADAVSGG